MSYKENPEDIVVNVKGPDGDTAEFVVPYDYDAEEWAQLFRTIMFWLTFSPATIDEYIVPVDGWPEVENVGEKEDEDGRTE